MNPQPVSLADELRKLVKEIEREGCSCDAMHGYTCGIHAKVAELSALLAQHAVAEPLQLPQLPSNSEERAKMHGMNCPASVMGHDDECTCGLRWRIALQTEQEMHNAWRKRAEEAEAAINVIAALEGEGLVKAANKIRVVFKCKANRTADPPQDCGWPTCGCDPSMEHAPDCAAMLDDESDYEHLDDAGTCTCGAQERRRIALVAHAVAAPQVSVPMREWLKAKHVELSAEQLWAVESYLVMNVLPVAPAHAAEQPKLTELRDKVLGEINTLVPQEGEFSLRNSSLYQRVEKLFSDALLTSPVAPPPPAKRERQATNIGMENIRGDSMPVVVPPSRPSPSSRKENVYTAKDTKGQLCAAIARVREMNRLKR